MNTVIDAELMSSASPYWRVHFPMDQSVTWGRRPKSRWKWTGKGDLSVDRQHLTIAGRRHRFLWPSASQVVRVRLQQVRNVNVTGRLLQFEVALEGDRTEIVRVRAENAKAAQDIAAALPATRTPEFSRKEDEKRAFEEALEQLGTQPVVTTALVAANVAVFLLMAYLGGGWLIPQPVVLVQWGTNFGPATVHGEWWRLFTSMFMHFGLVHLTLNMWVLWRLGRQIERMFGSVNYLAVYIFAGLSGSLVSIWWHPTVNSAGASGAIFGLLGGLLAFVLNPATRIPASIAVSHRNSGLAFIAYNLFSGFTHQGIDNACHLGGLAGGFLMGWVLARPLDPAVREQDGSRCALSTGVGMAALAALGCALAHRPPPPSADVPPPTITRHFIAFYPGSEHVVFNPGGAVQAAMQAVHDAYGTTASEAAVAAVRNMAEAGDAEAAFRLGRYYHLEATEPDYTLALKYYQLAALKHHGWAINNLGLLYKDGLGVPQNDDRAYAYFLEAAHQNDSWGYVNLARMTFAGRGAPADVQKALAWLEEGGRNNCTLCYIEEAAIYHSGTYRVRPDISKAVALLNKAAALGDPQAKLIVAELYIVGDGVPQSSLTSFNLLKTLSDNGDSDSSNLLAELSSDDKIRSYLFQTALGGVRQMPADLTQAFPQDQAKAIGYWERASQQGNCQAWIDLSSVLDRGIGVAADHQKAAGYVERAVRCEPSNSFYLWNLATRFYDANGATRDCVAAERLFTESLQKGYTDAGVNLGYIYDKGCSPIDRDDHRAFQIYLLCAKLGVPLCQNNVGAMLKHGRGVPAADVARGYGWIKLASLNGDDLAKANLQDPLFTLAIRNAGLADLANIQYRLLSVPADPREILSDPWY